MSAAPNDAFGINTPFSLALNPKVDPAEPQLRIMATYDASSDRYLAQSISIEHPVAAVTSTKIRSTKFATIMAYALKDELRGPNKDLEKIPAVKKFFTGSTGKTNAKIAASPSQAKLQEAAVVFRLARMCGFFPVRTVERCFGISYADAQRWIKEARKLSIL